MTRVDCPARWMGPPLAHIHIHTTQSGVRVSDTAAMHRFLRRRNDFQEYLITLLHITGGQPGRSTEVAALTWRDQANGACVLEWVCLGERMDGLVDRPSH